MNKYLFTAIICLSSYMSFGQEKKESYYLDDGGISNSRHLIKSNISALIHGQLDFRYEFIFNDKFSIELGGGTKLPYYLEYVGQKKDFLDTDEIAQDATGNHFSIMPKYYCVHKAPENIYIGFQYRNRKLFQDDFDIKTEDYTFYVGAQYATKYRFFIDFSLGVGIINYQYLNSNNNETEIWPIVPLEFKIGYSF